MRSIANPFHAEERKAKYLKAKYLKAKYRLGKRRSSRLFMAGFVLLQAAVC